MRTMEKEKEEETELKSCFGTFDDADENRGCGDCSSNGHCKSYKPVLEEHKANAVKEAISDRNAVSYQKEQANGKFIAYLLTFGALLVVFWLASQEV